MTGKEERMKTQGIKKFFLMFFKGVSYLILAITMIFVGMFCGYFTVQNIRIALGPSYMDIVLAEYFRWASKEKLTKEARPEDCEFLEPHEQDKRSGIYRVVACTLITRERTYYNIEYLMITGNTKYSYYEEVEHDGSK